VLVRKSEAVVKTHFQQAVRKHRGSPDWAEDQAFWDLRFIIQLAFHYLEVALLATNFQPCLLQELVGSAGARTRLARSLNVHLKVDVEQW
jgi:hypothetical protein